MGWDAIALVGKARWARSLGFWFIALPIFASLLKADIFGELLNVIQLPFSWGILYLASLFVFAGNIVFFVRCPAIVRKYESWSVFRLHVASFQGLIPLIASSAKVLTPAEQQALLARLHTKEIIVFRDDEGGVIPKDNALASSRNPEKFEKTIEQSSWKEACLPDVFSITRQAFQSARPLSRLLAITTYALGLSALVVVLAQSALNVLKYYLNT